MRREGEGETKADEDDADILHGVVGEQALEVVLHQRAEYPEHASDAGKRDDDDAPPPGRYAAEVKNDTDEAVDCDLGHDPAHQRRNMAGRCRMRQWQPDM